MSLFAIGLVLLSALTHAGWNLFGKKVSPGGAFFWHSTLWSALLASPLMGLNIDGLDRLSTETWWLVVLTGFFQAVYLTCLAAAYRHGELSIVYPLARSSPLLIVLFGSVFLGSAERISAWAVLGILLIVAGCIVLPMQHFRQLRWRNYQNRATLCALIAAAGTAGYSIVDDAATGLMRKQWPTPDADGDVALVYVVLQAWSALAWLTLFLLPSSDERRELVSLFRYWRSTALTGVMIMATYALVIWSMAYADDVSYVVAFRQVSIPIGVAMGWYFLGESLYRPKIVGVVVILLGLMMVVLG
ncbi:EamA family transporter [Marinobacter mangrovi]|uniref:EamA family transporter n=1 Tax=Marinobacter mangrovi TaxID=2803918 RepID=UPI001933280D|nr:EamA family transporter [Marinobacter mangrovi]